MLHRFGIFEFDSDRGPRFVQTIPERGDKFIAPLAEARIASEGGPSPRLLFLGAAAFLVIAAAVMALFFWTLKSDDPTVTVIAVSVFDNETGSPEYDRPVAAMSDMVVERLTKLDPMRISVIGNASVLRQPRNIRNLKAVAENIKADYILLGQLQRDDDGLRFVMHFIRIKDETHLKANRLSVADGNLAGLEAAVVDEFERATREYVLKRPAD